jgi:hypothetical protein
MMNENEIQLPTRIENVDEFVEKCLNVQDKLRIDDDLNELKFCVVSNIGSKLVKFSGLFSDRDVAIERAKEISMKSTITTAVVHFGKFCYFGDNMLLDTKTALKKFVDSCNEEIDHFQKRIENAKMIEDKPLQEESLKGESTPMDIEEETEEPEELVNTAEKETQEQPPLSQEEDIKNEDISESEEDNLIKKLKLFVQRGDRKKHRIDDQRYIVICHGKIDERSCIFRVVGSFETESEAERFAKKSFDLDSIDPLTKRFDYIVAKSFVFLNFPVNFATHVEKTTVDNNVMLEQFYQGEMMKNSDEYKQSIREIQESVSNAQKLEKKNVE